MKTFSDLMTALHFKAVTGFCFTEFIHLYGRDSNPDHWFYMFWMASVFFLNGANLRHILLAQLAPASAFTLFAPNDNSTVLGAVALKEFERPGLKCEYKLISRNEWILLKKECLKILGKITFKIFFIQISLTMWVLSN